MPCHISPIYFSSSRVHDDAKPIVQPTKCHHITFPAYEDGGGGGGGCHPFTTASSLVIQLPPCITHFSASIHGAHGTVSVVLNTTRDTPPLGERHPPQQPSSGINWQKEVLVSWHFQYTMVQSCRHISP
ncbi:hypothetical protein MY3296_001533 [Beauveria thailandica]